MAKRQFKGIWIPKSVWENREMSVMEKILLMEIDSLDNDFGCVASNKTISDSLMISPKTVSGLIRDLESKGLIKVNYKDLNSHSGRCIQIVYPPLLNSRPPSGFQDPPLENGIHSNTFSNTSNEVYRQSRKKSDFKPPTLKEVEAFFKEKKYSAAAAKKAFDYYDVADWKDSSGRPVKNWKQKMISVWFKEENKDNSPDQNDLFMTSVLDSMIPGN